MTDNGMTQLIDDYLDGELDDAGGEKLRAWLEADAKNVRAFVRQVFLHQQLREGMLAQNVSRSLEAAISTSAELLVPARAESRMRWARFNWNYLSVAALLLVGGMAGSWITSQFASPQANSITGTFNTESTPAAYLTTANGCNWGDNSLGVWTVGRSVNSGDELTLLEGIAEFRLASGVSLSIEGPASLMLVSPSTLVLQYGKLTAYVPWGNADFKVMAAGCRVVASDAEFGVRLTDNKLDIHVFSGDTTVGSSMASARLDEDDEELDGDMADGESYFTNAVITAGRALRLTAHGEVLKVAGWDKAELASFATKLSMSGHLPVTQTYVDQVMASQPIGYWRFERIVDLAVPNEIDSGLPLLIQDKSSLVGDKNNRSAEFRSDGDWYLSTNKKLPLADSDYSMEAWVKPSHLHRGRIMALDCRGKLYSGAALELQGGIGDAYGKRPGRLRYSHRRNTEKHDLGVPCLSPQPYAIRRWQHVVAVKEGAQMKLYLDGEPVAVANESSTLPDDAIVRVGVSNNRLTRKFIGQLDELAVYDRALSEDEIRQHFQAMNWTAKDYSLRESRSMETENPARWLLSRTDLVFAKFNDSSLFK